jgi:hypothetical protein
MDKKEEAKQLTEKMLQDPKTIEVKKEIMFWKMILSYLNFIKTNKRKENADKQ